jgi:hypothetical protein
LVADNLWKSTCTYKQFTCAYNLIHTPQWIRQPRHGGEKAGLSTYPQTPTIYYLDISPLAS